MDRNISASQMAEEIRIDTNTLELVHSKLINSSSLSSGKDGDHYGKTQILVEDCRICRTKHAC